MKVPIIDLKMTGIHLSNLAKQHHYSVGMLANKMHVSSQAIYKWYAGISLPSIENLLYLSRLYNMSMEDLLVFKSDQMYVKEELVYHYTIH